VSEKRVPKERIQLYLQPEICAWLASQAEGRNKPAGEALESWIVEKEYPTVRDRYCRGLSDAQILMLNRGEIAEMAEDDDIPLVWMILQGGARRAVAKLPVVLDPNIGPAEWRLQANNPHLVKLPDAESVPVVLDPTMMLDGYEARAVDAGERPRLVGTLQVALCAARMPVIYDPAMHPNEYKLVAGKNRVPWDAMRESDPEVPEKSPADGIEFTIESAIGHVEAYLNGGDELGDVAEKDVIAAIKFLREKLLAK
jgi:hypothetical protein